MYLCIYACYSCYKDFCPVGEGNSWEGVNWRKGGEYLTSAFIWYKKIKCGCQLSSQTLKLPSGSKYSSISRAFGQRECSWLQDRTAGEEALEKANKLSFCAKDTKIKSEPRGYPRTLCRSTCCGCRVGRWFSQKLDLPTPSTMGPSVAFSLLVRRWDMNGVALQHLLCKIYLFSIFVFISESNNPPIFTISPHLPILDWLPCRGMGWSSTGFRLPKLSLLKKFL